MITFDDINEKLLEIQRLVDEQYKLKIRRQKLEKITNNYSGKDK